MKAKFISAVLMATFLFVNFTSAQVKLDKRQNNNKIIYGKKSYKFKSYGNQKAEKILRSSSKTRSNDRDNERNRNGDQNRYGHYQHGGDPYYNTQDPFQDVYFGFNCTDFGQAAAFNPIMDQAAFITRNMDKIIRLHYSQVLDIFRLNVLFLSDFTHLQNHSQSYAFGASYGYHSTNYLLLEVIKNNYFDALEIILSRGQEARLDHYFYQYDLEGNRFFTSYHSYGSSCNSPDDPYYNNYYKNNSDNNTIFRKKNKKKKRG